MVRHASLLATLLLLPAAAYSLPLVDIPAGKVEFGSWMAKGGWESKRDRPDGWEAGDSSLRLVSRGNSALIATQRGFPLALGPAAKLRVKLKVKTVPRRTDLSKKSGDDAAFRLYLAFNRGGGLLKPPNTLAYVWTEKDDADVIIPSAHFPNLYYVSLGKGPTPADRWITVERDMEADYRRVFPKEPGLPALKAVMLKCDSNNTKTSAESTLASIELAP